MDMPKPGDRHRRLEALAGEWTGAETLYPSPWAPEQRTATGTFHNRVALDGFFLVNEYTEERDGQVVFRGHGVYGWDQAKERYTMHWFDSMGFPPNVALGTWDGDTLAFEDEGPMGKNRYVYTVGEGSFHFRIECSRDGGQSWQPMMEGDYRRI